MPRWFSIVGLKVLGGEWCEVVNICEILRHVECRGLVKAEVRRRVEHESEVLVTADEAVCVEHVARVRSRKVER